MIINGLRRFFTLDLTPPSMIIFKWQVAISRKWRICQRKGELTMKLKRLLILIACVLMVFAMMPFEAAALDVEENEPIIELGETDASQPSLWNQGDREQLRAGIENIRRIAGKDRYETSMQIAELIREYFTDFGSKLPNVILASGTDYPDALGASVVAYSEGAPIILVNKNNIKETAEYVAANIMDVGADFHGLLCGHVYIMGGNGAVPETMETELVAAGIDSSRITRYAGTNRYDTNLKVLQDYGNFTSYHAQNEIIVCSGKNYADALSASALGAPILLVGDKLTDEQKTFLAMLQPEVQRAIVILGGTGAVSEAVEAELATIAETTGLVLRRIYGKNRFETSKELAIDYFTGEPVTLAYGMNFPDGLSGALVCFVTSSPLLLATNTFTGDAKEAAQILGAIHMCVLGGESLISDEAALSVLDY